MAAAHVGASEEANDLQEEELADKLFNDAMQGQWKEVVKAYREHSKQAQKLKITKSGDTALHIAVSSSDEDQNNDALGLVDIITATNKSKEVANEILNIQNYNGNTALHIAAARGDAQLCHKMATEDPKLMLVRNNDGHTPLFLAVLFGKNKAFFCLHSHSDENWPLFRAGNGDTILHAAVSGEHFGLAYQIIQWYPDLVNTLNQNGMSPLHILASVPTAFKSSSRLGPCDRFIYHCLVVEKFKEDKETNKDCPVEAGSTSTGASSENVEDHTKTWGSSCGRLIGILVKGGNIQKENPPQLSAPVGQGNINVDADTENPPQQESSPAQEQQAGADHYYYLKRIYALFLKLKSALEMIDRSLPLGISRIMEIEKAKRQHARAYQVMKKLVEPTKTYRHVQNPQEISSTKGKRESNILQEVPDPFTKIEEVPDPKKRGHASGGSENKKDDQTLILIAAKNGVTEMVEYILEKFPVAIQDLDSENKNVALLAVENRQPLEKKKTPTPILIAAKNGVTEMVEYILKKFPVAVQDLDSENKNVALLAVENRQPHVFNFLLENKKQNVGSLLGQLDNNGNNALHLAAKYGPYRPWLTPGAALQMQWELKWYKFVKKFMPPRLSVRPNNKGQIPEEIFTETHKELQKQGGSWLVKTSESCSVVAALIATVAFATSASVPGGLDNSSGEPIFRDKPVFDAFTISSLLALCLSVTALVFFLSILTSRYEAHDFSAKLPRKLLFGLTSLFASIGAVLVSFCTGHVFLLDHQLKYIAYPMYAATCLPVTIFALAQLPLYYDLLRVIFKKVPQRSYKEYKTR